jgi:hypothetical protein
MVKKVNKKKKDEEVIAPKPQQVTGGKISDDFCHYSYKVKEGVGLGSHNVKGKGIVDEDMKIAFSRFNAHLACLDDVFKRSNIQMDNIDSYHSHEITNLYTVTGFQMKGSEEAPSIILIGTKYSDTAGGHIDIKTPKINLDRGAFYQWYNELKEAADKAISEVEQYIAGKYTLPKDDKDENPNQLTIDGVAADIDLEGSKV